MACGGPLLASQSSKGNGDTAKRFSRSSASPQGRGSDGIRPMGRIPSDPLPWGDADDLEKRLAVSPLPLELWLASSGPPQAMERKLKPLQSQVVQAGYHCEQIANDLSHARLLRCRFQAMGRSE